MKYKEQKIWLGCEKLKSDKNKSLLMSTTGFIEST